MTLGSHATLGRELTHGEFADALQDDGVLFREGILDGVEEASRCSAPTFWLTPSRVEYLLTSCQLFIVAPLSHPTMAFERTPRNYIALGAGGPGNLASRF